MAIFHSFKELFNQTYSGRKPERDFALLMEYYFPTQLNKPMTNQVDLVGRFEGINTRQRVEQIVNTFLMNLKNAKSREVFSIKSLIFEVLRIIEANGRYISLEDLALAMSQTQSLAGLFELAPLFEISIDHIKLYDINQSVYIVPSEIDVGLINNGIIYARRLANHFGSIYPFDALMSHSAWKAIPSNRRRGFVRSLLQSEESCITLGDGDFFSYPKFFERDRIRSRLKKIYSVYESVPIDNLVSSLLRSIGKRIRPRTKRNLEILEACSDVFAEYCLRAGYCVESDGSFFASEYLKKYIRSNPEEENSTFLDEISLVKQIKDFGKPMPTEDFMPLLRQINTQDSHIMESADLIYRTGYRRNSKYHVLDDQYSSMRQGTVYNNRTRFELNRLVRDSYLVKKIKRIYSYQCQICRTKLEVGDDEFYSEVHHIMPLGMPHCGPDTLDNMICVCPNCHILLDYGVIPIDVSQLLNYEKNPLSIQSINYHNEEIYQGK